MLQSCFLYLLKLYLICLWVIENTTNVIIVHAYVIYIDNVVKYYHPWNEGNFSSAWHVIIPHVPDTAFVKVAGNGIIYWSGWQFKLEFQVWNQWLQHRCRGLEFGAGGYKTGIPGRTPFLCCFYSWFCVQMRIHKSQARKESNKRAALVWLVLVENQ